MLDFSAYWLEHHKHHKLGMGTEDDGGSVGVDGCAEDGFTGLHGSVVEEGDVEDRKSALQVIVFVVDGGL